MLERFFGATITVSTGRVVPVRLIGEQHVIEDLGFIDDKSGCRPNVPTHFGEFRIAP